MATPQRFQKSNKVVSIKFEVLLIGLENYGVRI